MFPKLENATRFVGSPVFAAVTATVAALVGLLGSVYQTEIASAFPLTPWGPYASVSWRALVFWASLFLLAWFVYLRQVVDDRARATLVTTTEAAEQTSRRIEEFVQTLPPRAFQSELARAVAGVHTAVSAAMPRRRSADVGRVDMVQVIRGILHAVADLAIMYDDQPLVAGQRARYSANVMLFVPANPGRVPARIDLFPDSYDRQQLLGVLTLRTDLSASSDSGEHHAPDDAVASLTLPVPRDAERNGRWLALPGAPLAFLTGKITGYSDTSTLGGWCREKGNFPPSVADDLDAYFLHGAGREIRSFLSKPLPDRLGVLNIHANRPELLGRADRRETFQALLTPVLQDLADAVRELVGLEAASTLPPTAGRGTIGNGETR